MIPKLTRNQFITLLKSKLKAPYVWGANGPDKFDCSGFCYWAFKQAGMKISDTTAAGFYKLSKPVTNKRYQTGDMVFLRNRRDGGIGHMAMLLYPNTRGDWVVIEERGTATGVILTTLAGDWEKKRTFAGTRRLSDFRLLPDVPAGSFRVTSAAMEKVGTGGPKDYIGVGNALNSLIPNSAIIFTTESNKAMRMAYGEALGKTFSRRVHPAGNDTTIFYNNTLFTNVDGRRDYVYFDRKGHGAVAIPLADANGKTFTAIAIHVRPYSLTNLTGKTKDIKQAIALAGNGPAIIGGDFATIRAASLLKAAGFVRATPDVDTFDKKGIQRTDAVWVRGFSATNGRKVDSGPWSDHAWMEAEVTPNGILSN